MQHRTEVGTLKTGLYPESANAPGCMGLCVATDLHRGSDRRWPMLP